jgi:hypothetical protein
VNTNLPSFNLDQFFYGYALSLGKKKKQRIQQIKEVVMEIYNGNTDRAFSQWKFFKKL